jgi:hypothetical protein
MKAEHILALLAACDRPTIDRVLAHGITMLDLEDGDPDLEEPGLEDSFCSHHADGPGCPVADHGELDGDETDHNGSEEDFIVHTLWGGAPGCPIADPDYCEGERS